MPNNIITGNSFVDKIRPYIPNPEYNPKTKKGHVQSPVLVDSSTPAINDDFMSRTMNSVNRLTFTGRELGFTNEYIERDADLGISLSPYNTEEQLNAARAENQGALTKIGNGFIQAGLGEVVVGTLEGFGNIADGIINTFTGDNYGQNPWTNYWAGIHEDIRNKYQIYQRDPNASWQAGDLGWWMNGLTNIATTASLMLPAAGWARGLSYLGKIGKLGKLSNWASRGLARVAKAGKAENSFGAMRQALSKANRIERTINDGSQILGTAVLSRMGENYMEGKQVYDDVYSKSKENLENMPNAEFTKFLARNPEFANMSKDDIAKEIARKSANRTFYNDFAMLLMDIPQFKALGKLWGKGLRRSSTASERIAAENARRTLAGRPAEELIKDNFINRAKDGIRYGLKNPRQSLAALELGEGFEEMYQGIQSDKGMEVATKYFDPTMTPRTIGSYLSDGSIWEQGFWGTLGGVAFNAIGQGIREGGRKVEGLWNKKHMSADDYERWKRAHDKVGIEQINNITSKVDEYINNLRMIDEGKNPFEVLRDATTGQEVIVNGQMQNEEIDENQKQLLRDKAIKKFIDDTTMDAIDTGIFDTMKSVIDSQEFNQYLTKNGVTINGDDVNLGQSTVSRMDEVADMYQNELQNVDALADTTNPFTTIATARSIVRNKMKLQDYNATLANIQDRINEISEDKDAENTYTEKAAYNMYKEQVENLLKQKAQLEKDYNDGNISKAAYTRRSRDIDNTIKVWNNWAAVNTSEGLLTETRKEFENTLGQEGADYFEGFNKFLNQFKSDIEQNASEPIDSVKELIDQRLEEEKRKNYTEAQIPLNQQQYQDAYNEFARAMNEMEKKRAKDYMDTIKNYIENADNIDEAVDNLMHGRVNNKKLQDAFDYLQYGYQSMRGEDMDARDIEQMMSDFNIDATIEEARNKRQQAEQRNQAAVNEGVEPPPANDNNQQEEQTDNDSLSTGQVEQSETTNTTETITQAGQTNTATTETKPQPQTQRTDNANVDLGGGDDTLRNPMDTDRRADTLDESYDTPNLRAEIKARKYVMQVGFKNPKRLKDIADALANGDTTQRDKLLSEITDYLVGTGVDKVTAAHIAANAFVGTVNLFGTTTSNNGFRELAIQLAAGFSKKAAEKANDRKAITALIDGSELDEIVDEFLTKYSELTKNKALSSGRTVINLESLFDYLLNNPDVSIETAMYIYDNLSKYIAKNDNKKYIFTGFNTAQGLYLNSKEFIDALKVNKAQHRDALKKMHISPIELAQRSSKRDSAEYRVALLAAVNGKPGTRILVEPNYITISETLPNGKVNTRQKMANLDIIVEYKNDKNKIVRKKIGILRTVQNSSDGNLIYPISHQSGFRNEITTNNDNDNITLDCDFLFNAIINRTGEAGEQLWNDISEYYLTVRDIIDRRKPGKISFEDAKKELDGAMSKEMADRIMNNSLIQQALFKDVYKFDKRVKNDNASRARDISGKIASILFFGREDDVNDATNDEHNSFATDSETLANRYDMWKQEVKTNYEQTARFQDAIEKGETPVISRLNVRTSIIPNTTPNGTVNNIKDLPLRLDNTDPNYTPLVMVIGGRLKGLDGTDYGYAGPSIRDYSMGFITYKDNNVTYISYFKNSPEVKNSPIAKAAKTEFVRLLKAQLSNIYRATGNTDEDAESARVHDENFRNIGTILKEMIGPGGLFRTGNIRITYSNNSNTIQIYRYDPATKKNTPIAVLYSYDSKGNRGNAITAYDAQGNKVTFNSINGTGNLTAETVNTWINYLADTVFNSVKFNRSKLAFDKNNNTTLFNNTNNGFDINLGGKNYHYRDYADFLVQNGAFETNIQADDNDSFVKFVMNEGQITADTSIASTSDVQSTESHAVSDMLYTSDRNPKRKTANTADILEAAGISKETIDTLLQPVAGIPLVTKQIVVSGDREDAKFYYDKTDKRIHITPTGAFAINGNKSNAVRLILHENLHRHFNSSKITPAERQRILDELQTVYDYVRQKLVEDHDTGKINNNFFNQVTSVLDTVNSYQDQNVRMEEFLVECFTQAPFTRWLNDTDYTLGNADILGIPTKKKSILQKIVDIILNLLGVNNGNIRNNSILAREYVIMSRDITLAELTDNADTAGQAVSTRKTSPVERRGKQTPASASPINSSALDKGKAKVDEIEQYFGSRITRSDNFAEDHTYYLDGKTPIDTSVTQKIHGKQDVGKYGVPASTLGNSADAAARAHFENNGEMPEDTVIPNVTDEQKEMLAESMKTIEQMLDAKFGKGHYRVVTKEFPIGGTVEVNGEQKTIAGTMDMIVYTDKGEFWIFDFKTKRANINANISPETLVGYKQQVNIYRQLIEANFPELKGKVHTGSLIKFSVEYPEPSDTVKYRANPNNSGQLQISTDGGNTYTDIQDALIDYTAPIIVDDINNTNVFIPVEEQDYGDAIGALPEPETNGPDLNNSIARPTITPPDTGNPEEDYTPEDADDIDFDGEILEATTNEIQDDANSSVEIYAPAVVNDSADNAYGIKRVGSMKEFVDSFPVGYQPFIEQMIASNELNYTCQ